MKTSYCIFVILYQNKLFELITRINMFVITGFRFNAKGNTLDFKGNSIFV